MTPGHVLGRLRLDPARLTVLASWGARLVSAGTQLITIPLLVRYMGVNAYGIYVVTVSLLAWYLLADLGLGYTLQNRISGLISSEAPHADDVVSVSVGFATLVPALVGLALLTAPWVTGRLWSPDQRVLTDNSRLVSVAAVMFVLTAFGNLAYRILYAQRKGWLPNVAQGAASLVTLVLVVASSHVEIEPASRLLLMVMAFGAPQALLAMGLLGQVVMRARMDGGRVRPEIFVQTLRKSTGFFAFGLLSLVTLQVDYIVLNATMDSINVIQYNVIAKVLGLTLVLFQAVLQAHWPFCAEAAHARDWDAIHVRLRSLLKQGGALVMVGGLLYALLESRIMAVASPKAPAVLGFGAVGLYTLYLMLRIWSDTYAMVLQSMGRLKIFVIYVPVQAALAVGMQIVGARTFGVEGLIGGLVLSFLLSSCWVLPAYLRRVEKR